jgi:hypothetical protein
MAQRGKSTAASKRSSGTARKPAARSTKTPAKKTAATRSGSKQTRGASASKTTRKTPARGAAKAPARGAAKAPARGAAKAPTRGAAKAPGRRTAKAPATRAAKAPARKGAAPRKTATRGTTSKLTQQTTDHEEIRRWAEERGGRPARVKGTGAGDDVGMIRIDFPGYSGKESLEPIEWDEFFQKFEEGQLALIYQEKTARGQKSNFNKLVKR